MPVLVLDVTEAEADKILLTLDPLAGLATVDEGNLRSLMDSVKFSSDELAAALQPLWPGRPELPELKDPPAQIDRAGELKAKWGTTAGQLWQIGDHRILCGAAGTAAQVTIPLYAGMGSENYPVTTKSPRAQKYFDQGLAFAYGFNHDEAERSFGQAARIDQQMAMAYWGIALLVLGPNYNLPGDKERGARAYAAMQQARALEGGMTAKERDLIMALAYR